MDGERGAGKGRDNRELQHATFLSHRRYLEVRCFPIQLVFHFHIILYSIFSLTKAISLKIWRDHYPGVRNVYVGFLLVAQKLKLLCGGRWGRRMNGKGDKGGVW